MRLLKHLSRASVPVLTKFDACYEKPTEPQDRGADVSSGRRNTRTDTANFGAKGPSLE